MSDEYDDLSASNSSISVQLKQISHRPNVLSVQVERVANAINDAEKYSYQFNVKIIGLQELNSSETAPKTSSLCVKLFQEMGAEVSILDIDIAHRVSTRNESEGPKPVVCTFVRRLAKGKVMEVRQRASQVNPTSEVSACLLKTSLAEQESSIILPPRSRTCYLRRKNSKSGIIINFVGLKTPPFI